MKSVLLLPLEFSTWYQARAWSYTGAYAFMDGMEENGIDCTILPLFCDRTESDVPAQLEHYKSIISGQYDEVWVWSVHTYLNEEFWQWVQGLAPIVVGVLMESLHHTDDDLETFPKLNDRVQVVLEDLINCTHALTCNLTDADFIREKLGINAIWYPVMVSERFVRAEPPSPAGKASFIGTCYGEREQYLKKGLLNDVLDRPHLPERETSVPELFDETCSNFREKMGKGLIRNPEELEIEVNKIRAVREKLFELHLDGLRMGSANVNLPSIVKAYAGRVVESMAAGVPALSWLPPGDEMETLYKPDEDLLLFDDVRSLRVAIEKINESSRELAKSMVVTARNKLLLRHTARIRIQQFRQWIEKGTPPDYSSDKGYRPTLHECAYYDEFFNHSDYWSPITPNRDEKSRWEIIQSYVSGICREKEYSLEIAEIGCGRGWLSELVSDYGKVTAIEPVAEVAIRAARRKSDVTYLTGSAETLLFLGYQRSYDVVISSEVLEHVPHQAKSQFVNSVVELAKDGGYIIVSTPRADIQEEWLAQYEEPNQPVEDWMFEAEVAEFFEKAGCEKVHLRRAFFMDIYQVWLFRKKMSR